VPRRTLLIAGCALAVAAGAFRVTAPPGPGLDPDALQYLGAARALVADGALRVPLAAWWSDSTAEPLSHFPPGYSVVLAAPIALGADARLAARLVQAVAAGLTTATLMLLLWPAAGAWGAVLGAVALTLSPAFVMVHLAVLSEPLFLALVTFALWGFTRRPRDAWLHGLTAAAATMVRYAGLSVAGAAALWAMLDTSASWRDRLRRATIAVAPSLLAMMVWSRTHKPDRTLALNDGWGATLQQGVRTAGHLLAPSLEWEPVPWLAAGAMLTALAAMSWRAARAPRDDTPDDRDRGAQHESAGAVLAASAVLIFAYVALIVASRAVADRGIPFDFRIAAPLVPLATASLVLMAFRAWRATSRPWRVVGTLALTIWGAAAARTDFSQVREALTYGNDFASRDWRDSPTLAWVRAQDPARALYTNFPCAIWFHLDRVARGLPGTLDPATMREFVARLRATHGAVVAWNERNVDMAPNDSIVMRAGLVRVAAFDDGSVFEPAPLADTVAPPLPAKNPAAPPVAPPPARH